MAATSKRIGSGNVAQRLATPLIAILGPALGGAFLIPHPWIGAFLWLAIFQNLRFAAFALLGVAIAEILIRSYHIRETSLIDGSLKANALLAAIAVAWLTEPTDTPVQTQIAVAIASAVVAIGVAGALMRVVANANLPTLVLGHCFVATMLFAIFPHWTELAVGSMVWWPVPTDPLGWVVTFFRTLGALLFSPTLGVGLVVAAAVLLWSRVAFVAGVVGWIAGIVTATALSQEGVIYYWMPTAYNFFLAGMGLGAVFFLPGLAGLILAAMGGSAAAVYAVGLQHLFPATALGYLPIASALAIWIGICALALADERSVLRRNQTTELPPEEAWWRAAYWSRRSGRQGPFLVLPTSGRAQIAQGMDGSLSHIGPWRHALDFQSPESLDQPAADAGKAASWNGAAVAPAGGVVERVRNNVVDNPTGICNYAEPWGNYVIIRLDQGGWAQLAHLRCGKVAVQPGMRVEIGSYLGEVGNSGRSPSPHLHLQVQSSPELGAPTVPFRLANFLSEAYAEGARLQWHSSAMPGQGTIVLPALPNPEVHSIVTSVAPGTAVWRVESTGTIPRPLRPARAATTTRIAISLDAVGRHLFRGMAGGALVSSLDADAWRIVELQAGAAPLLKLLALAVPSIPYAAASGMMWEELAPLVAAGVMRWLGLSLSPYLPQPFIEVRCQCVSVPEGRDGPLAVETQLETASRWLPSKLTCQFERLRGPVRLEASFQGGTLTYSLLSFEPGLPFDAEAE